MGETNIRCEAVPTADGGWRVSLIFEHGSYSTELNVGQARSRERARKMGEKALRRERGIQRDLHERQRFEIEVDPPPPDDPPPPPPHDSDVMA